MASMKAVLEDLGSGRVQCLEVPQPEPRAGGLLVQVHYSAISAGTERAKLQAGQRSLAGKALSRPDLVRQVFDHARQKGIRSAYEKVRSRLNSLSPLGYSCSGVVLTVGPDIDGFRPGDRVACAGAGYANHCEVDFIPRNLAVPIPPAVDLAAASLTTIGAIAMQGLRQSQLAFGETVAVVGAGLVGVLTIQLARAAGLRVIAIDRDPMRAEAAKGFGAHLTFAADDPDLIPRAQEFSRYGVDAAIVTAASPGPQPLELAALLARDRARLVVVGDVGMGVSRRALYDKELAVVLSRSYGPGRYDPSFEEQGHDYPLAYVRWTETRNMQAFVDLLASGTINVSPLLTKRFPIAEAESAYRELESSHPYTVILEYSAAGGLPKTESAPQAPLLRMPHAIGRLGIGCIGAGGFAREVLFPRLREVEDLHLASVATSSGITAHSARMQFGFSMCETPDELLANPAVNTVVISTRHDSHARFVVSALKAGKAVFVEKPLATTPEELTTICDAYSERSSAGKQSFVMVGFNRRFAPFTDAVRSFFAGRSEPMGINIRVNAGYVPWSHWTQQKEGGGRIVGELCHFVDWARSIAGCPVRQVWATALADKCKYLHDNVVAVLTFADSSVATLQYFANGDKAVPKESFEIFCEGAIAQLDDFRTLHLTRNGKTRSSKSRQDKGHARELTLTFEALRAGQQAPIPFSEIVEVTTVTFEIQASIATAQQIVVA